MNESPADPLIAEPPITGVAATASPAPNASADDTNRDANHAARPARQDVLMGLSDALSPAPEQAVANGEAAPRGHRYENQLAMARLGIATSLFYALRTKHVPTAAHSLRVAMASSAWCQRLGLSDEQRDRIEVAALLHDIGKIGIPDRILRKPAKLTVEEQLTMECCSGLGCEILRGCTSDSELLDIVRWSNEWYDSRRRDDRMRGDALPLGARMLSITGAFDAMTSDQVYRSAMSRERALQELFRGAGTQFDPELTRDFAAMLEDRPELLHQAVVHRWLQQLDGSKTAFLNGSPAIQNVPLESQLASPLDLSSELPIHAASSSHSMLHHLQSLSRNLRDGVAFLDGEGQVMMWNETMARMTGVSSDAIVGRQWDAEVVGLLSRDPNESGECPVSECLQRQNVVARSMKLRRGKETRDVFVQTSPVQEAVGGGVVLFIRDTSDRAELQNQIQTLHKKATSDGLTGVANRAELDRCLRHATNQAKLQGKTFGLIICDIDHFKKVNDVYGHPAGDEALIEFAAVLQQHAREQDLVARYGGEEFVMLSIGSDNATAARRAEEIRRAIAAKPLQGLGGNSVTASFGVTEFQTGDAAETVLARADRALLQAKQNGRNRVVQLGGGIEPGEPKAETTGWFQWWVSTKPQREFVFDLATPVPMDLAVEKLRGFIADHRAEIIHVTPEEVSLRVTTSGTGGRRAADSRFALSVRVSLKEDRVSLGVIAGKRSLRTLVTATIEPIRSRDRRNRDLQPSVKELASSLRSYLMAEWVEKPTGTS